MKLFLCQACKQPVHFENTECVSCGHALGYLPRKFVLSALESEEDAWQALADPGTLYVSCANSIHNACNWLIPRTSETRMCDACRHNAIVPDLGNGDDLSRWRKIEAAKHHLFYSLMRWNLPIPDRTEDPEKGLAFHFLSEELAPAGSPVLTGHESGIITLNVAEADDQERESRRTAMGETYRTVLGHFRHEIGHYYWDVLVRDTDQLPPFRELFGDETQDYAEALQVHYTKAANSDWKSKYITLYASAHPWEDFAECWAHYMHIVDSLETAGAFGIRVRPSANLAEELRADIDFDPYRADLSALIDAWVPVTIAINSVNRSMGQPDLYPFVLSPKVVEKIGFIHKLIQERMSIPISSREAD